MEAAIKATFDEQLADELIDYMRTSRRGNKFAIYVYSLSEAAWVTLDRFLEEVLLFLS